MERFREFLNTTRAGNTTGEVVYGRFVHDLPNKKIADIEKNAQSAYCSPPDCLESVHKMVMKSQQIRGKEDDVEDVNETQETIIQNIYDWNVKKDYADGLVTSLYELISKNGEAKKFIGDPIADSLAIVTRRNSAILALADGVSWGSKSRLAATCSIYGSVKYLDKHLPSCRNTRDVFKHILNAFEHAQQCIVNQQGTMTTLCVGVVIPLQGKNRYGLCVVNVGDSYAYIFNKHYGVKEVTEGSHPLDQIRDMRHSGGALGPADGYNPDLSNLTCSFVVLEENDLVFLCSDGISDNFDPVVSKKPPLLNLESDGVTSLSSSPESTSSILKQEGSFSSKKLVKQGTESFEDISDPLLTSHTATSANTRTLSSSDSLNTSSKTVVTDLLCCRCLTKKRQPENTKRHSLSNDSYDNVGHDENAPLLANDNVSKRDVEKTSKLSGTDEKTSMNAHRGESKDSKDNHHYLNVNLEDKRQTSNVIVAVKNKRNSPIEHLLNDNIHFVASKNKRNSPLSILSDTTESKIGHGIGGNEKRPSSIKECFPDLPDHKSLKSDSSTKITDPLSVYVEEKRNEGNQLKSKTDVNSVVAAEPQVKSCTNMNSLSEKDAGCLTDGKMNSLNTGNKSGFPHCSECGKRLSRGDYVSLTTETSQGVVLKDDLSSIVDFDNGALVEGGIQAKVSSSSVDTKETTKRRISQSVSLDNIQKKGNHLHLAEENRGKSSSFTEGEKANSNVDVNKNLTARQRRDAALHEMNSIIAQKLEMEEGTGSSVNVGEICAQVVNFVVSNTNQKRTILEKVPQAVLNKMTSKERRLHQEKVKKELQGVPGKLDHASIVCYEVGWHDERENKISMTEQSYKRVYSQPQLNNKPASLKPGIYTRSKSLGTTLSLPKNKLDPSLATMPINGYFGMAAAAML